MKNFFVILKALIFMCCVYPANAAGIYNPEVRSFDKYGFPYYSDIEDYKNMVGKTVMYIPEYVPSRDDKKGFSGKFNEPYIITKIRKNTSSRMTIFLKEKNGVGRSQMVVNNKYHYTNYTYYCITSLYTIPLLLIDDIELDKVKYIGSKYPQNSKVQNYTITNIKTHNYSKKGYPAVCFEITDNRTNNVFYAPISDSTALNMLGEVFINDSVKASYEIVELQPEKYIIENSITKERTEINRGKDYEETSQLCFKDDLSGYYVASLSNVEKPENPDIRYGETQKIDDDNVTKFSYTDSHIEFVIFASLSQFNFSLKNTSNVSLRNCLSFNNLKYWLSVV